MAPQRKTYEVLVEHPDSRAPLTSIRVEAFSTAEAVQIARAFIAGVTYHPRVRTL